MNPAWIAALAALTGVLGGVLIWLARRTWALFRLAYNFLADWNGVPGDNRGHEARPGVMQRLAVLERSVADIHGQVHLNSGHSLKDAIARTEIAVGQNTSQLAVLKQTVDNLKAP